MSEKDNSTKIAGLPALKLKQRRFTELALVNAPGIKKELKESIIKSTIKSSTGVNNEIPERLAGKVQEVAALTFNKTEFGIYIAEVDKWVSAHPEWNQVEDIDDINNIAFEKVFQYRLLLQRGKKDIEDNLSSSKRRENVYRTNLGAMRATKRDAGGNSARSISIAIFAGEIDENKIKAIRHKSHSEKQEEDELFPVVDIGAKNVVPL
jgi:hypothetical protein